MIGHVRNAYDSAPALRALIGSTAGLVPPSLRFGRSYRTTSAMLKASVHWTDGQLRQVKLCRLKSVLELAGSSVPYYRELFRRLRFEPGRMTSVHDLEQLPLLTRDMVREQGRRLVPEGLSESAYRYTTTGGTSSGEPLGFYIAHEASAAEWAFITDAWSRVGYDPSQWRAVFRGTVPRGRSKGRLWEVDHLTKGVVFSTFDMNERNLATYVEEMRRRRISFIHAYPSSALVLAQYLDGTDSRVPSLRGWLLGSEQLTTGQRAYLERVGGVPVLSWYGHSEKCVLAVECGSPGSMHPYQLYGHAELTRPDGTAIVGAGERGAVTGTGFITGATLFVRYQTDDFAEWLEGDCPCGAIGPAFTRLEGRAQESLYGRSGVRVSLVSMNLHSSVYAKLERFRFVQERPGVAELLYVPRAGFSADDLVQLKTEFSAKLEGEIELRYREVDELLRTGLGKFKYIDQRIDTPSV